MKYTGQFKNINDVLYQIDFDVNNEVNETAELILSSDPFIVDYNAGDAIFEPLKLSNATCSIITNELLTDLFSSKVHDVKCTLKNITSNKIEWVGYTTPCLYSQGWQNEYETLELELIDGLSTLENFEYKQANEAKKTYISFIDLIINSIKKTGCYNNIFINNNLFVDGVNNLNNIVENLYVHEMNFLSDDGGKNNSLKDVLYNIMQFLNFTLITDGDSVYILDYKFINGGLSEYTKYSTINNWLTYSTTIENNINDIKPLTANKFRKNGSKINLTDTKNKAIIEVETKVINDLIPEFFDDTLLKNITFENGVDNSYFVHPIYQGDSTHIIRWVRNSKVNDINYYKATGAPAYVETYLEYYDSLRIWDERYLGGTLRQIASYKNNEIPSKLNFENYLALKCWTNGGASQKRMFEYVGDKDIALLYDDYYFIIDCQINHDTVFDSYAPKEDDKPETINQQQALATGMYLPMKIQIGNKFWNGTNWTTTDSKFSLEFDLLGKKKLYNKWYNVKNQTMYYDELDGEGQKIPISKDDYLVGNPIITIYSPTYVTTTYSIFIGTIWLKDFEIKLIKKENLLGVQKKDTDTVYSNVINDEFINEFDPINLKLNTDVNKGLCFSSVLLKNDNSDFQLLETINSQTSSGSKKQEYNIIENFVELYQNPKNKLTLNLNNDLKPYSILQHDSKNYLIDSYSIDYFNNSGEYNVLNIE